uniref:Protein arginine methyltransferase NDUFAF7, mitochondrial n=1 Tax=Daphnia dolichocephala TaxID=2282166 RepID=A0A4Y7M0F9_9CRUS|nr:EOG090X06OK [Daphnia dolichocephala]
MQSCSRRLMACLSQKIGPTVCRRGFSDKTTAAVEGNTNMLLRQIQARMLAGGPITVADYMKEVLTNPTAGYYMNRDVFGQKGDFITSPEVSQMFGELIAVWLVNEWTKCGRPKPFQVVELGPGRGTLMSDILRVFSKFKIAESDFAVSLVEVSPYLSKVQEKQLCTTQTEEAAKLPEDSQHYKQARSLYGSPVRWYNHITDLPRTFTLFLAHEFFDALPIHKLVKVDQGWREVLIDLNREHFTLRYVLSRDRTPACLYRLDSETREELEVSPQSLVITQIMASRIHQDGGVGLVIDYGHEGDKTDTFRGFKNHKLHDPLVEPGTADLTADVDFAALKWAATNPRAAEDWKANLTYGTVDQKDFLTRMGIDTRLEQLLASCRNEALASDLKSAHRMLTDPNEMGSKFKFLALYPSVMEKILQRYPPPGFSNLVGVVAVSTGVAVVGWLGWKAYAREIAATIEADFEVIESIGAIDWIDSVVPQDDDIVECSPECDQNVDNVSEELNNLDLITIGETTDSHLDHGLFCAPSLDCVQEPCAYVSIVDPIVPIIEEIMESTTSMAINDEDAQVPMDQTAIAIETSTDDPAVEEQAHISTRHELVVIVPTEGTQSIDGSPEVLPNAPIVPCIKQKPKRNASYQRRLLRRANERAQKELLAKATIAAECDPAQ